MEYNHLKIELKWQRYWQENKTFKTEKDLSKKKCYVLDMFPYPSGAGLHVGHPLGYTATDIYSRFKRLQGFNVLHPMGWDAFGLPAEQYAIKTGTHPISKALSDQEIYPFSDLLLHDMGPGLADNRPEASANGREWRTPPLWGIGLINVVNGHTNFLHDGRARNLKEAILWHGGEAERSKRNFMHLSKANRDKIISFLNSL